MNLAGIVAEASLNYVYKVTPQKNGALLPVGSFIDRNFKANQFEYYFQDSFRVTPKLTITFGLRHSLAQAPYETAGQQVAPNSQACTVGSKREWLKRPRDSSSNQASPSSRQEKQTVGNPCTNMDKWDIAPRFGVAYALNPKNLDPRRLRRKLR